jgi:hypothetical protein
MMSSGLFTSLLAAAVPLCSGIWATLVGFEYIGKPVGAELNPNYKIRQRVYKTCGPAMIGLALILVAKAFLEPLPPLKWQRYAPPDGHFSVEMPGTPLESDVEEPGEYGPAKSHLARVELRGKNIVCFIRHTPWPDRFPDLTREQKEERLKETLKSIVASSKGKLVEEKGFDHPAGPGRQFRIQMPGGAVSRFVLLSLDRNDIQLMFIAPADMADSAIAGRLFASFRYDAGAANDPQAAPEATE